MGEPLSPFLLQAAAAPQGGGMSFFLMLGGMLAVLYFIMIRPEAKKQKKHQTMISALKRGDEIILNSGIFGKVVSVDQQTLTIEIADKTKIKVLKNAVTALSKSLPEEQKDSDKSTEAAKAS
jgi:preprotein translocase subunit YajC